MRVWCASRPISQTLLFCAGYMLCNKVHKKAAQQQYGPSIFYWCLYCMGCCCFCARAAVLNPATAGVVPTGHNGLDIVFVTLIAPVTPINMKYLSHNHKQWTAEAAHQGGW